MLSPVILSVMTGVEKVRPNFQFLQLTKFPYQHHWSRAFSSCRSRVCSEYSIFGHCFNEFNWFFNASFSHFRIKISWFAVCRLWLSFSSEICISESSSRHESSSFLSITVSWIPFWHWSNSDRILLFSFSSWRILFRRLSFSASHVFNVFCRFWICSPLLSYKSGS